MAEPKENSLQMIKEETLGESLITSSDGTNSYYLNADSQAMKALAERSPELLENHQSEDYQDVKIHVTVDIYRENITDVSLQYQLDEYSVPMSDKELGLLTEAMQEIGTDIHKDARESSEKWQNYGNADYLDKGGLQIRATHYGDNEENCRLDVVQLKEHPDAVAVGLGENSDVMLYSFQQINMQDIEHCRNVNDFMEQYGLNEDSTVKEIAEALMKSTKEIKEIGYDEWNESLKSSSGEYISFQPVCSEIERTTNKLELAQILQGVGIDVSERLHELELEQKAGLHIGIVEKSIDNPQIMCENGESFLNYYIAADDRTLKELCDRTYLFEESGLDSFYDLVCSGWHESYVDMYVNAYQDGSMNVFLTYGGSEYNVPMKKDELELLEYKMKKIGMDVQEDLEMYYDELSEIRSEKNSFVKD